MSDVRVVYDASLHMMESILHQCVAGKSIETGELTAQVRNLIQGVKEHETEFLMLTDGGTPENHLIGHSVNCTIFSIVLGLELRYTDQQLERVAMASLLHDIGMMQVMDIVKEHTKLSSSAFDEVKKHPGYSVKMLEKFVGLDEIVLKVASEHHERADGSGYPLGLKNNEIHEYAAIVGLVEVYEALTHPRPHRKEMPPFEAIKEILLSKKIFNLKVVKALLNRLSIYPVGTYLELNTKAVGQVVEVNLSFPMRPKLKIIRDHRKQSPDTVTFIDLTQNVNLYVARCLNHDDLEQLNIQTD